ncbi:hypothetical protein OPV22_009880 [Ensete ventricosum]|uniref:Uncharacterized protein n=1 Tax=Ensete ventricosum TaxID=4639 RepID=A0AAV8R681_ENSVE|nr:hypothetical protein OPV22_009880 [Ensete ventricosum]
MAGKRTSASLMADEVVRQKETSLSGKSSSGYFGAVFPSTSTAKAKGLPQLDLYWTLNKRSTDTNTGSAQRMTTENQKKVGPSKSIKEGIYPSESTELAYFGSSVHYGARDFYTTSSDTNTCVNPINHYKTHGENISGNSNIATRGEWWQGSLYY